MKSVLMNKVEIKSMIHEISIFVLLTKTPIDVDVAAKPHFMPDKFSMKVWSSLWHVMHSGRSRSLFLLQWRKINICLTVADHWEIEWISSGGQISSSFFSWIPKQMCLGGSGPSGWGVRAQWEVVLGLNLEVGGQMGVRVMAGLRSRWGQSIQPPQGGV